jgi:hypothetical protein
MIVTPYRHYGDQDNKQMTSLIIPTNTGPWALRYVWIQHTQDNEKFYTNYFNPELNQAGMNVRKQTAELKSDWEAHNQIFYDSAVNGNLVWRVKIGNPRSHSIDYIEIWRDSKIVGKYFGNTPAEKINHNIEWRLSSRTTFNQHLYKAGFDIRSWRPYQTISKEVAIEYYKNFVEQYKNKQQCIINTPWNRELNPL